MKVECIVVGAGILGLACARRLAMSGREVVILESNNTFGPGISSRNSEVIHAGIYYPKNSLKAKLCVSGRKQLYEYCASHSIHYQKLGKLIVANDKSEILQLEEIHKKAIANEVNDLEYLSQTELKNFEPQILAEAALFSPSTGIIDSHQFMLALLGDAEAAGAMLVVKNQVVGGDIASGKIILQVQDQENKIMKIEAKNVINATGLNATNIAKSIQGFSKQFIPSTYYCKGTYFTLGTPSPFKHLIYPVPSTAGLGVHLTLDLAGQARFGPDTEWVTEINYEIENKRSKVFYDAISRYWPALQQGALLPGYVGIRPKIVGPNEPAADFMIQCENTHKIPGLVNLFGIESPGLTAALAIADFVLEKGEFSQR